MQSEIPKQFITIAGKPLLMHTLDKFHNYSEDLEIKLVIPSPFIEFWNSLCKRFDFITPHQVIEGGSSRFFSVKNGLQGIRNQSLVAIHDGVRPLVSSETIQRVFQSAEEMGNAVPVVNINESIRRITTESNIPVSRNEFKVIQTPQCFHSEILIRAYSQDYREDFTDDATVIEALGIKINLVDGNYENIKITRPVDLKMAEAFLK